MIEVIEPGLQFYVDKFVNGERFAFTRYGNGEWDLILGRGTRTGSGSQRFSDDLRVAMRQTLTNARDERFITAMQSRSYLQRQRLWEPLNAWLTENEVAREWHCGEVFHRASRHGQLFPLLDAMRKHNIVVVGPPHLLGLRFTSMFVPVRARDCWQDFEAIEAQLRGFSNCIISFSAGPTAKVLIHRLYPVLKSCWLIDFGSLWDVYGGKPSRRYHHDMTPQIMKRNLGGT